MSRVRNGPTLGSTLVRLTALLAVIITGCQDSQVNPAPVIADTLSSENVAAGDHPVVGDSKQNSTGRDIAQKTEELDWLDAGVDLINADSLDRWEEINFGGEGEISITDGVLKFEAGDPFTGLSSTREKLPKTNYEISLDARKMDGIDFFCGLTFPVDESHCTLIVGGWGGATVGLSCINDVDASSNETCTYLKFEKERWYKLRVRVLPKTISVWIDDQRIIHQDIEGRKISLRGDTELCKPMGICSFMTVAEFKNARIRRFAPLNISPESQPESSTSTGQPNGKE